MAYAVNLVKRKHLILWLFR